MAAIGDIFLVTSAKFGYSPQFIDAYATGVRGNYIFELGLASGGDQALLVQSAEITSGVA